LFLQPCAHELAQDLLDRPSRLVCTTSTLTVILLLHQNTD
jgi:hypothetical protein